MKFVARFLLCLAALLAGWLFHPNPAGEGPAALQASSLEVEVEGPCAVREAPDQGNLELRLQGLGYFN